MSICERWSTILGRITQVFPIDLLKDNGLTLRLLESSKQLKSDFLINSLV